MNLYVNNQASLCSMWSYWNLIYQTGCMNRIAIFADIYSHKIIEYKARSFVWAGLWIQLVLAVLIGLNLDSKWGCKGFWGFVRPVSAFSSIG